MCVCHVAGLAVAVAVGGSDADVVDLSAGQAADVTGAHALAGSGAAIAVGQVGRGRVRSCALLPHHTQAVRGAVHIQ